MRLRELGLEELTRYPSVRLRRLAVIGVERANNGFSLTIADGSVVFCRVLLIATGRVDELPARPGFKALYGRGVYHCPYCDGWEHRDEPLISYGRTFQAYEVALELLTWSSTVTLCSDGPADLAEAERQKLAANHITLCEQPVSELKPGTGGFLEAVRFSNGSTLPCRALFFVSDCPQQSLLPAELGCSIGPGGGLLSDDHAATDVPGLFVAGNVRCGLHLAITAAAEGAEAGVAINERLLDASLR